MNTKDPLDQNNAINDDGRAYNSSPVILIVPGLIALCVAILAIYGLVENLPGWVLGQ